jgi:hypothetical protein
MKTLIIPLAITLAVSPAIVRGDFNPIPLKASSFTHDIVVEKTAPPPYVSYSTTVTMDGGTNETGATWYEQGFNKGQPWTGLPPAGTTFTPTESSFANYTFKMPDTYAGNCAIFISTQVRTGTLQLTTPTKLNGLGILGSSGGGETKVDVTVRFADGSSELTTVTLLDWHNGGVAAWCSNGRFNLNDGIFQNIGGSTATGVPKLFPVGITVTNFSSDVTRIDFAYNTGNRGAILAVSGSTDNYNYNIPLQVTGFNQDVVVEANSPAKPRALFTATTATWEGGSANFGRTFFEIGTDRSDATRLKLGLPAPGTTFTNSAGNRAYRMAPSYTANNALLLDDAHSGTLQISGGGTYDSLSFLASSANGEGKIIINVNHSDGMTDYYETNVPAWNAAGTAAYDPNGLLSPQDTSFQNINPSGNEGVLWSVDIPTTNSTAPITSVDFTYTGDAARRTVVFAVAGRTASSGVFFAPVNVTGFNADVVIEKEQKLWWANNDALWPPGLFSATTASMDNGTNNFAWTWYERGYNTNAPATGLPPADSLIDSKSNPTRHYKMPATYVGPNAVLIDVNNQVANITPVTAESFTSISLLTAGASIGGNNVMTNFCVVQLADGTAETNVFYGYDWFNGQAAPAFIADGRVNLNSRTIGNLYGGNPKLFESQFVLKNTSSQVTNILVGYRTAGGANWTTYVLAMSGSKDAVAPVFALPAVPSMTVFEGTNLTFTATAAGTPVINYRWQYSPDGTTWTFLDNGGVYSGADTDTITLSGITLAHAGQYRTIATNSVGATTNTAGTLNVFNGSPDVTKPGDPVTYFGSDDAWDGGPANFIDNNVGSKCLLPHLPTSNPVNCGFIVTPSMSSTVLRGIRLYTANDATERDPASVMVEGSNDDGKTWTVILPEKALALPDGRNSGTAVPNPAVHQMQEINFTNNTAGYFSYKVTFLSLKGTPGMVQLAEAELLGMPNPVPPMLVRNPNPTVAVYAGGSPTFGITAVGSGPITYQWYMNNVIIPDATNSIYTFANAQAADAGKQFRAVATNPFGSTNSTSGTFTIIAKPTQAYPAAILADSPIAFWRLAEGPDDGQGNNGLLANDYMGGHIGVYSNAVLGVAGYNSAVDANTAASFGASATANSFVGGIQDLSFATPATTSKSFSIEAWVNGDVQTADAGIVTKGNGGAEQFNLDTGGGNHGFRFYMRDASGATHGASSSQPLDTKWHHVVGVWDAAKSNVVLYVDGIEAAKATGIPAGLGTLDTTVPVSIGSRKSGSTTAYDNQFIGSVDEVAIYATALSSNQVLAHYFAANPAPKFTSHPTNSVAAEGGSVTFYSKAYGPGTLAYQWYQSTDGGVSFTPLSGKTTENLTITPVPLSSEGYQFQVTATTAYGTSTSSNAILSVLSGPPTLDPDLPAARVVYAGRDVTATVGVTGSAPFTYKWYREGVVLTEGGRFSGTATATLKIANIQTTDAGNYYVEVKNAYATTPSTTMALSVTTVPSFANNGAGWSLNGGATFTDSVLTLTEAVNSQARSSFFPDPLYIGGFFASFIYQNQTGGGADGFAFVVQNDPDGVKALGGAGGALALNGIEPSAAITFNIYNASGMAFGVNGSTGSPYTPVDPIDFSAKNPIYVEIEYANGMANVTLVDSNTIPTRSFAAEIAVGSLPQIVGTNTAYVGFTGATGGVNATQQIRDFKYIPYPALSAARVNASTLSFTWTGLVSGYKVQRRDSLTSGTWQDVPTGEVTQVNGENTVTVPSTGTGFYRLVFQ